MRATKIIKNQGEDILLFGQKNIARYISAQQQNYILRNDANMYIRLIRNEAKGNAITGRLVIDGRWFCNTLERKGVEIPALCYHVAVTMSPRFKRLLPIVQNVPQRSGIRIHRGSKPEHSSGCVLVPDRVTEDKLTQIILKAQQEHEEIILEVSDFRAGTEYGYNHPCERELQQYEIDARRAEQRYYEFHPEECKD